MKYKIKHLMCTARNGFQGLALLTMATSVPGLVPFCAAKGVCDPTAGQSAAVFVALYQIGRAHV